MNVFLKRILSNGIKIVRVLLSFMIPVKKGKIMFESIPDYSDNARVLSDYLLQNTKCNLLWSVDNVNKYESTVRIRFVEKNGGDSLLGKLKFVYHTVSSQYLFSTHGSFHYANRRKQKYIVLWHGMPIKKIVRLQDATSTANYLNNSSYILCTSSYYVPIFSKCFGKPASEILPIGIPRNDLLFYESDVLNKLQLTINKEEKLIVYLQC